MKNIRLIIAAVVVGIFACAVDLACSTMQSAPPVPQPKLGAQGPLTFNEILSGYGPDVASSTLIGPSVGGLLRAGSLAITCSIAKGTGDASVPLDVYLQGLVATNPDVWVDYIHFAQQNITLSSSTVTYTTATDMYAPTPLAVGIGADDAAGVALAAANTSHGHPGDQLRLVAVTGSGIIFSPSLTTCYISGRQ